MILPKASSPPGRALPLGVAPGGREQDPSSRLFQTGAARMADPSMHPPGLQPPPGGVGAIGFGFRLSLVAKSKAIWI